MGEGVGFDFHDAHKTEKGRAIATKLLTKFTPKITATIPDEFLLQVMRSGNTGKRLHDAPRIDDSRDI